VGTVVIHVVAGRAQVAREHILQVVSGVIAAKMYAHSPVVWSMLTP
jgi:hypothetical protein